MTTQPSPISVSIASPQEVVELQYAPLKEVARTVLTGEGIKAAKISLAFVDDVTSARLNKQFLDHDGPTDVLTFPLSNKGAKKLEGELVIGAEVALRTAKEYTHGVHEELCLYIIHGLLHLCGYDDRTPQATKEMRNKEREYLARCGLPNIADE
mgnify:CR=1 FL=1